MVVQRRAASHRARPAGIDPPAPFGSPSASVEVSMGNNANANANVGGRKFAEQRNKYSSAARKSPSMVLFWPCMVLLFIAAAFFGALDDAYYMIFGGSDQKYAAYHRGRHEPSVPSSASHGHHGPQSVSVAANLGSALSWAGVEQEDDGQDNPFEHFPEYASVRTLAQPIDRDLVISRESLDFETYVPSRPRSMAVYFTSATRSHFHSIELLDPNDDPTHHQGVQLPHDHKFKGFPETEEQRKFQKETLANSRKYKKALPDPFETDECAMQYEWQGGYNPTCNLVLEQDMTLVFDPHYKHLPNYPMEVPSHPLEEIVDDEGEDDEDDTNGHRRLAEEHHKRHHSFHHPIKYLAGGYYRDVWRMITPLADEENDGHDGRSVLKTLRYMHDYTKRNFDRHRRDAVAMERLTGSEYIMDIYAFCANSGMFEFADGGSLDDAIFGGKDGGGWSSKERLVVSHQAASGVAAVHTTDSKTMAAISHTDISASQFVYLNKLGMFKLNDFNRARFILKDRETGKPCPFAVASNKGKFRAPEEYVKPHVETEKIDVFSLGNILYIILTETFPFEKLSEDDAQEEVRKGGRPHISKELLESTDPFLQALVKAINMCWRQDPKERSSATEVVDHLDKSLKKLGVAAKGER